MIYIKKPILYKKTVIIFCFCFEKGSIFWAGSQNPGPGLRKKLVAWQLGIDI